ncbi:C4-dicarboxylate ABC transporter substrate-binding protein [Betaproteobacteria bacterium]|nr:C4-dicarboxylate ABC transporter substrate-binding protein [Betaproteobacteria bacterium]GHU01962.1 C4-dicarboxylate ABC transporter substrate-binding protein [Betaproteobacteria bacterium]GHU20471.1 C4-dicarboxylate ABC transporter substrate-binding protein [Betaproteobacteria bacterium]
MRKTTLATAATVLTAAFALSGLFAPTPAVAQQRFVTIGTGSVTGVYYAVGGAICRSVNRSRSEHGIRCSAESTAASTYNINTLRAGELVFGIAQSDAQYNAYRGQGAFKGHGAFTELRTVFALYHEPLTILARQDAGITKFEDLRGKRFNIGNPGSGTRTTIDDLLAGLGMTVHDFAPASELKPDEHGAALCANTIDSFAFVVGHPAANIQEPAAACSAQLVSLTGPAIDKLIAKHPYYAIATIPGGMYANNPHDTQTYGVVATVVTSSRVPDAVVYAVVKSVFETLDDFKKLHPALADLAPKHMIRDGLSAPLHNGAVRYYKEKGWL